MFYYHGDSCRMSLVTEQVYMLNVYILPYSFSNCYTNQSIVTS